MEINATAGFGASALSSDLSRLISSNSRTSEVALLDGTTGQPLWRIAHPSPDNNYVIRAASFSPDDSQIAYILTDGTLNIVRASDGSMDPAVDDHRRARVGGGLLQQRHAAGDGHGPGRVSRDGSCQRRGAGEGDPPARAHGAGDQGGVLARRHVDRQPGTRGSVPDLSLKVWRTNDAALVYVKDVNTNNRRQRGIRHVPRLRHHRLHRRQPDKKMYLLNARDGSVKSTIDESADVTSSHFLPMAAG